jgi:hypothetical protein
MERSPDMSKTKVKRQLTTKSAGGQVKHLHFQMYLGAVLAIREPLASQRAAETTAGARGPAITDTAFKGVL